MRCDVTSASRRRTACGEGSGNTPLWGECGSVRQCVGASVEARENTPLWGEGGSVRQCVGAFVGARGNPPPLFCNLK